MIHEFPNADALALALADHFATAMRGRLERDGRAAIAVSGGTTPAKFFQALARQDLNWSAVTVTLVDDRWVSESSPRSNAGLVKANLLQGPAAAAKFLSLFNTAATPSQARAAVEASLRSIALPFAAIALGMGTDGHTASFFPGGDRLSKALNPEEGRLVETINAEAAEEPRITLTLPVLLAADTLVIHIEGAAKREALNAALQKGRVSDMPVRAVLMHEPQPDIFWSP